MSNDDKTIITFRKDGVPSPSAGASNSGFQRPMPGGRGAPTSNATALPPQPVLSVAPQSSPLPGVLPVASAVQAPQPITQSPQPLVNPRPLIAPKVNAQVYVNPLVHCANDLIDRMAFLRSGMLNNGQPLSDGPMDNDPAIFRDEIVRLLGEFERQCGQLSINEENILYARYVICTVIDEFASKTLWGGQGAWSSQSLLSQFHDETNGGEKFFQILEHLQAQPATYLNVLELMYIAMSLGFEGKYSLINRGNVEIENLRDNLFHLMRLQRGEPERDLSPHWQGVSEKRYALMKHVPVWVVSAVAGVVLLVLYSGFSYQLSNSQDQILASLQAPIVEYALPVSSLEDEKSTVSIENESQEQEQ